MVNPGKLDVPTLGPCTVESPLLQQWAHAHEGGRFVSDEDKILVDDALKSVSSALARNEPLAAFESAGPRRTIFFDPANTCCAIVTCGGLCPGLNDVVRGLVLQAYDRYGLRKVYGIRCGYEGLIKAYGHPVLELTPDKVKNIHIIWGKHLRHVPRASEF
jgi:6-phosphofructokinase 1